MSELWQTDCLGKYCYIKARIGWRGLSASEYTESGPYLIAGKHVENGLIDWDACDHISELRYRESWEIALSEGDVILTKDGTIGRVARLDFLPGKATINGTMMLVRPEEGLNYRFLYHVLNGAEFKGLIDDKVSGSSIPHIFQRDLINLPISFPPIEHQIKLAEVLDTLDTAIRETEALIGKLKVIKQGLLLDLLTRGIDASGQLRPPQSEAPQLYKASPLGWIPREWEVCPLYQQADVIDPQPDHRTPKEQENGVPYVGIGDFDEHGRVCFSSCRRVVQRAFVKQRLRFKVEDGDIIYGKIGTIGKPKRLIAGDYALTANVLLLKPKSNPALFFMILSSAFERQILDITNTTSQPALGIETVRNLWVFKAPIFENELISERLEPLFSKISIETDMLHKLQQQKAGLMDDLLTGHVRVTPLLESVQQAAAQAGA